MALLEAHNITHSYQVDGRRIPVVDDVSLRVSTGEFVAMGVAAAAVIGIIVILIVSSGDDEDAGGAEEVNVSGIEEPARPERVDPVLILGRDTLGAGLTLSF